MSSNTFESAFVAAFLELYSPLVQLLSFFSRLYRKVYEKAYQFGKSRIYGTFLNNGTSGFPKYGTFPKKGLLGSGKTKLFLLIAIGI
jgi:hypothetical protein